MARSSGRLIRRYWVLSPREDDLLHAVTEESRSTTAKAHLGALDGRLIALDAKTGKPVWT